MKSHVFMLPHPIWVDEMNIQRHDIISLVGHPQVETHSNPDDAIQQCLDILLRLLDCIWHNPPSEFMPGLERYVGVEEPNKGLEYRVD